jgi:hypothetical protein
VERSGRLIVAGAQAEGQLLSPLAMGVEGPAVLLARVGHPPTAEPRAEERAFRLVVRGSALVDSRGETGFVGPTVGLLVLPVKTGTTIHRAAPLSFPHHPRR